VRTSENLEEEIGTTGYVEPDISIRFTDAPYYSAWVVSGEERDIEDGNPIGTWDRAFEREQDHWMEEEIKEGLEKREKVREKEWMKHPGYQFMGLDEVEARRAMEEIHNIQQHGPTPRSRRPGTPPSHPSSTLPSQPTTSATAKDNLWNCFRSDFPYDLASNDSLKMRLNSIPTSAHGTLFDRSFILLFFPVFCFLSFFGFFDRNAPTSSSPPKATKSGW